MAIVFIVTQFLLRALIISAVVFLFVTILHFFIEWIRAIIDRRRTTIIIEEVSTKKKK